MATSCSHRTFLRTWFYLISIFAVAYSWDSDDLELFDLVEEINRNFYDFIGVTQSSSTGDVKKAYRKQTLLLHPDKNKADDAEDQFRKLVAVYEVLKDEEKRKKYDSVLENGLPDWRQPVFYYRKVRKLGVLEMMAFVCGICTVGHYFVLWAIYLERRLAMEDYFNSKKKREKKGKKKAANVNDQIEDAMQETLDSIPKPRLLDLWPMTLSCWLVMTVVSIPTYMRRVKELRQMAEDRRRMEIEEKEREAAFFEEIEQRRLRRKQKPDISDATPAAVAEATPVIYGEIDQELSSDNEDDMQPTSREGKWDDEDSVLLSKAYLRFPGGTANRWEKIADFVGRPVSEVTAKCKEMKGNLQMNLSASVQGNNPKPAKKNIDISDTIISKQEPEWIGPGANDRDADQPKARKRNKNKPVKEKERTFAIQKETVTPEVGIKTCARTEKTNSSSNLANQTGNVTAPNKSEKSVMNSVNQSQKFANTQTGSGDKVRISSGAKSINPSSNKPEKSVAKSVKPNKVKESDKAANIDDEGAKETSDAWSQNQQVILEWAIKQYPKGTEQRWEKIAKDIPGKNKEDCIARFKLLAEIFKQRKQQAS